MKLIATRLAAAAALCVAASASATTFTGFSGAGISQAEFHQGLMDSLDFGGLKASKTPIPAGAYEPQSLNASPVASLHLPSMLNAVRNGGSVFEAAGARVHIYGAKSENKRSWFLCLSIEGGDVVYKKGSKLIHYYLIDRTGYFDLNGRSFEVYIEGQLRNKMGSKLVVNDVTDKNNKVNVAKFTMQQLVDSVYLSGRQLRVSGREFRAFYADNFDENSRGEFGNYTGRRSLVFLFKEGAAYKGYHWPESALPREQVVFAAPRIEGEDKAEAGSFVIGLNYKTDGTLLVYQQ